eukprot:SAG31_NODE_3865_length_3800_cov_25.525662_2_plen_297_part_00
MDLTSQPGPLSGPPRWEPPQRRARDHRDGRRRATAGNYEDFPRPQAGDWEKRLVEELERERAVTEEAERQEEIQRERMRVELEERLAAAQAAAKGVTPPPPPGFAGVHGTRQQQQRQQRASSWGSANSREQPRQKTPFQSKAEVEAEQQRLRAEGERLLKEAQARQAKAKADAAERLAREAAAKAAKAAKERQEAAAVQGCEEAWQRFEDRFAGSEALIRLTDVPVPPDLAGNPLCLPPSATTEQKKAALRRCSLRWHPDKFYGKFGRRAPESEKEAMKAKATEVFQAINAYREKL